jgi:hypothetical protein
MGLATQVVMGLVAMMAALVIIPTEAVTKMFGYLGITDLAFSAWLVATAAGTLGGFQIALIASLLYSLTTRELRRAWGSKKLSINGDTGLGAQLVHVSSWTTAYLRSVFMSLMKGGRVTRPDKLRFKWVEHTRAGGFAATRTAKALSWGLGFLFNRRVAAVAA